MGDAGKGLVLQEFQQGAPIDLEELPDPPQGMADFVVDLLDGNGDESGGEIRQHLFEPETLSQGYLVDFQRLNLHSTSPVFPHLPDSIENFEKINIREARRSA